MARIETVDYERIPSEAKQMRELGQQLNNEFVNVYQNVDEMRSDWYGRRYNTLLTEFNKVIPILNDMFDLVVTKLPYNLETVANNYSNADQGQNVCQAQQVAYTKINELGISSATGLRFITESISAAQMKITSSFDKASEFMVRIEQVLNGMTWESDAAAVFKNQFRTMKNNIVNAISEIKNAFITNMNQTKEDIQAAESANIAK